MFCPSHLLPAADTEAHRTATPRDVPGSRLLPTHRAARLQSGLPDVASPGVSDDGAKFGSPPGVRSAQPATPDLYSFFGRFMMFAMLDWSECTVVERGPGKSRSMWRFKGTHVPATLLFENLEDGATVNDFLDWYPGVTRAQVVAVLEFAERSLVEA
jgi:uncharacterized protein (DUF433 family)